MARCLACGKEFDLRDSHDCLHEPTDSSRRQRARIIELLEGDKAFAGKVIEQIYVEICEVNRNLYRLILIADPEEKAAWIEDQKRRGASTSATENLIHYPLPGDPEPTTTPEFSPMTPDDQAAVERWRNNSTEEQPDAARLIWIDAGDHYRADRVVRRMRDDSISIRDAIDLQMKEENQDA